jgi:hypothetical protein
VTTTFAEPAGASCWVDETISHQDGKPGSTSLVAIRHGDVQVVVHKRPPDEWFLTMYIARRALVYCEKLEECTELEDAKKLALERALGVLEERIDDLLAAKRVIERAR